MTDETPFQQAFYEQNAINGLVVCLACVVRGLKSTLGGLAEHDALTFLAFDLEHHTILLETALNDAEAAAKQKDDSQ